MGGRKKTNSKPYFAGLDGLRALAVIAVVLYHLFPAIVPGGFVGVDIFFVISGFLITSLLIAEHAKSGRINLKQFWLRRARRLLPALFVTIGVTCSIALFIGGDILVGLGRQVLGAATFSNNWVEVAAGDNYFDASSLHLFTNFWSLAVEEQFYAGWPFVLVIVLSIAALTRRYRAGFWVSTCLAVASASLMFLFFTENNVTRVYYGTDTHAFGLMLGAALAFLGNLRYAKALHRNDPWPSARFKHTWTLQGLGLVAFVSVVASVLYLPELSEITYKGGLLAVSILTGIIILASVSGRGLLQRLLEVRWIKWIGIRSYGIYLWHWPLLVLCHYAVPPQLAWATPIIVSLTTLAAASLSYHYLEQPVRLAGIAAFVRQRIRWNGGVLKGKLVPHPFMIASIALIGLSVAAIITAPAKTQAQRQIEAGLASVEHTSKHPAKAVVKKPKVITGRDISLVGDSVSLASAPELQAKFPGIYINAEVSRSMRRGGLETVEQLLAAKQLRKVLVVALGTNGYFGDGTIQQLLNEVGKDRDVIFVTAHAPVVWVPDNNNYVHQVAKRYPNVYVAEWDRTISAQADILGPDGIHPGPTGGTLYAKSIAAAIAKIEQR